MAKTKWQLSKFKDKKNGGMTAAGVAQYRKENPGSKLKTGVNKKPVTQEEKRRQGSFLTRFYTNPKGPFKKPNGEPTRLALAAKKWNSPVPKNSQDAAKLAAKGRRLLEQAKKMKKK